MKKGNLFLLCFVLIFCASGIALKNDTNYSNTTFEENLSYGVNTTFEENLSSIAGEISDKNVRQEYIKDTMGIFYEIILDIVSRDNIKDIVAVAVVVIGVLSLFLFSVFYGGMPGVMYFERAAIFHKRAELAYLNGNYIKAQRFYDKSYLLREMGEDKIFGRKNDGSI